MRSRLWLAAVAALLLALSGACTPQPVIRLLDPLPQAQAIRTINDNSRRVVGVLKATGSIRAKMTTADGTLERSGLEGVLIYASPDHLHFAISHDLAGRQLRVGTNGTYYWYEERDQPPVCRRYDELAGGRDPELPMQPAQIVEALGLLPLPEGAEVSASDTPMQRVEGDVQQLLYITYDDAGAPHLQKEYWLARVEPRTLTRVVFRDAMGRVEMESRLSGHRRLGEGGPLLPTRIVVDWPLEASHLEFHVTRWESLPHLGKDLPAFRPPLARE